MTFLSNWPGKYVIGLTGNIATGKSVVRRMLEHLGAYGIDADALAHRAIAKGAPGYQPVIDMFGKWVLNENGEVDRSKVGKLVFADQQALKQLEKIVHPHVEQAIHMLIQHAIQRVIVIEAIKLLEGPLSRSCDTIWTTFAPEKTQKQRLVTKRGISEEEALQRIHAQAPQESKTSAAKVVINNVGTFDNVWQQVVAAWKRISANADTIPVVLKRAEAGELAVQRGRPRDSAKIASFINRLSGSTQLVTEDDIMADFGEKAFLLLIAENQLVGLAGWQVENLVTRTTDILLDPMIPAMQALKTLVSEVERASKDLQCEASLIFLPNQLANQDSIWKNLGYDNLTPQSLGIQAWQDAALESQPPNTILLFKQLRHDRVLRPI